MQIEFYLRLVLATLCGGLIGRERKTRLKEAGMRTHIIVAIGSCLIMILSKYGFEDILASEAMKVDAARLAAQVVSGVGFLGAGMILIRKNIISGLTTAAGIWTTSGIGLAIGAGMWQLGLFCTLLIIIVQSIIHLSFMPHQDHVIIILKDRNDIDKLTEFLKSKNIKINDFRFAQKENSKTVELSYYLAFTKEYNRHSFVVDAAKLDYILTVDM